MSPTDPELVRRAMAGSQEAFRLLVERHGRAVFTLVARMVRNDAIAEELAQDAFLKAFNALRTYDPSFKFSNWILRIAHNVAIDHLRRARPAVVSIDDADGGEADELVEARERSPFDHAVHGDLQRDLDLALARLRPEFRRLVVMRYLQDLSYEEIAEIVGLPLGTVKSHLHRARAALARAMSEAGWAPEGGRPRESPADGTIMQPGAGSDS